MWSPCTALIEISDSYVLENFPSTLFAKVDTILLFKNQTLLWYSPMAGQYGWCSTCKELRYGVDAGKQGYCDKYLGSSETRQE